MDIIQKICEENCIKKLGITPRTSTHYIQRILDLEKGRAFTIHIERFDKKKLKIIAKPEDTLQNLWKNLRFSLNFPGKGVNWRAVKRKYNLSYQSQTIQDSSTLSSLGITGGSTLKFQRKIKN